VAADVGLKLVLDTAAIAEFEHTTGKVIGVFAENQYLLMLHDLVENTAGDRFVYLRILNKRHLRGDRGVVVLPVELHTDGDHVIILIRIFRHALRTWVLEAPRGFGEPGLDGPSNARRELLEETGLEAVALEHLGTVEPDSGLMHNPAEVYLAFVSPEAATHASPEPTEMIDGLVRFTTRELDAYIAQRHISDGYTLAAVALARAQGFLC
jgi:ADP-ribose pyrophosphatase